MMPTAAAALPSKSVTVMVGARELHMEILELATRNVWQSVEPVSPGVYEAFPLESGWVRVGIGAGAMDEHWFERSPGAAEIGPMQEREIGGLRFAFCARPPAEGPTLPAGPTGPRRLLVDKHHVLRFQAGRHVPILHVPGDEGGDFVHVIEGGPDKPARALPDGWEVREVWIERDWVVRLPAPATVFFFRNRDSFQGPIPEAPPARTG